MAVDCTCRCTACQLVKAHIPGGAHCKNRDTGCNVE